MTQTDTPIQPKRTSRKRGMLGIIGAIVLAVMLLGCLCTLPYSLGQVADPLNPNGGTRPRYDIQALDVNLLPPSWVPYVESETAQVDAYLSRLGAMKQQDDTPVADSGTTDTPFWLFGTDELGRDFFIRCLAGGGISLCIGLAAALISVFIGTTYGMIAGYSGGRIDATMMRIVDVLYGLPYVLLVVLLAVAIDGVIDRLDSSALIASQSAGTEEIPWWLEWIRGHMGLLNVVTLLVAIGGVSWLTMARVIRGQVLSLKKQPYMEACRAIGVPVHRQFIRHLLPNLTGPIVVYATLTVPQAILQESFLSFLGIGIQPPLPSWGSLASAGLGQLNPVESRWWLLFWPCLLLGVTLLSLNFIGEGLRERLDPKRRDRSHSDA